MNQRLYTPGPVQLHPDVAAAVCASPLYHRSNEFTALANEVWRGLRDVFRSDHRVVLVSGSGMTGIEACIASTVSEGHTVLVVRHGRFGERLSVINRIYGARVVEIVVDWGETITPDEILARCADVVHIDAFWCVHAETSTGATLDVASIAAAIRGRYPEALIMVDAVLSVGIEPLESTAWDLDGVVAGIQKGLMCPPGLACVHVSPRLERRLHADRRTYTTDLSVAVRDQDEGRFTWTPPVTLIAGLAASIMYLQTTGMETVWEIQRVRADLVRRLLRQRGFNLYGISNARGVVVAEHPASAEIKRRLEREHAMIVAGGQDRLSGRVLRIGTCGWYADGMIDDLFAAIDTILSDTPIAP